MKVAVLGIKDHVRALDIDAETTIESFKDTVSNEFQYPRKDLILSCEGRILSEGCLDDFVGDNSTVHVSYALLGGGKKRKKKTYTTLKKTKHIRKKIPLSPLNYFAVQDGQVVRLRKYCKTCNCGVFMAQHFTRYYCGKCHRTIPYEGGQQPPKRAPFYVKPKADSKETDAPVAKKGKKGKK
ncbi:hypothetical protein SNEBB_010661 [Seison nebaliae]|nr:hypothetical protein SNEBB_010661 [Seison nebaliae]